MDFLDAVSFHANALALSLGENIVDVAVGTKKFLVDDGKEFSWKLYSKFRNAIGLNDPVSRGLVGLFGYVTHIVGGTMVGAGEAIGNGAGMIATGVEGHIRNQGETIALGATNVIGGLGAGLAMGVAPAMPRPQIAMQTLNVGSDGALVLGAVSVTVDAPAIGGIVFATAVDGGMMAMVGNADDGVGAAQLHVLPRAKPPLSTRKLLTYEDLLELAERSEETNLHSNAIRARLSGRQFTAQLPREVGFGPNECLVFDFQLFDTTGNFIGELTVKVDPKSSAILNVSFS